MPDCVFYSFAGLIWRDRFHMFPRLPGIHSELEKIVHGMAEILLAAEITFRGLNRGVSQQELNLLQLSSAIVTQLRTGPPEIMRRDVLQPGSLATGSDHVPDNVLR
jgi:hypothetical protein